MTKPSIHTLGELKKSGYNSSIKEEMRQNLIPMLKAGKHPFKGIFGYEDSVLPAVERVFWLHTTFYSRTFGTSENKNCSADGRIA